MSACSSEEIDRLRSLATTIGDTEPTWAMLAEAADLDLALMNRATSS